MTVLAEYCLEKDAIYIISLTKNHNMGNSYWIHMERGRRKRRNMNTTGIGHVGQKLSLSGAPVGDRKT